MDGSVLHNSFLLELFNAAMSENYVLSVVVEHLKPTYFPEEETALKKFFTELQSQVQLEGKKPSYGTMRVAFRKDKEVLELIKEMQDSDRSDTDTLLRTLEEFIKQAMFVEAYDSTADLYNKKKRKDAYNAMYKAANAINGFSLTNNQFEQILGNFPKRNVERIKEHNAQSNKMPTGIDELDYYTNGGPEVGEFVLFMARAKEGKSICLTSLGVNYARRGHGVAHFQIEGTKKQAAARYDSHILGITYHDIKAGEIEDKKFQAYHKIVDNLGKTDIHLFAAESFESINMQQIRRMLIDLKKKYPNVKVVIIDYLDLVNPDGQKYDQSNERQRQIRTAQAMKALAMDKELGGLLVISATQTSGVIAEEVDDPDFVLRREHLAENKAKVNPVDMLISINRTADERKNRLCRLWLEALREHDADKLITIKQNLKYTRFYDRKATMEEGLIQNLQ